MLTLTKMGGGYVDFYNPHCLLTGKGTGLKILFLKSRNQKIGKKIAVNLFIVPPSEGVLKLKKWKYQKLTVCE